MHGCKVACTCSSMLKCVRSFSTSRGTSHYDVLGVTPAATQSDIKTAYYRLSMLYHPDKCTEEAANKKFRAIKEAYEVLGNLQLKKLYDKGLMPGSRAARPFKPEPEPTDPTLRFYKSHERRSVVPTMDGHTPIYDFDAWAKNHYGEVFKKGKRDRATVLRKKDRFEQSSRTASQEYGIYAAFIMVAMFLGIVFNRPDRFDIVKTKDKHANPES